MEKKSFFPVRILITSTGQEMICKTTNEIPNATAFKVLETNINVDFIIRNKL